MENDFIFDLDRFCKFHDIDEMNFTVKNSDDESNPGFYYCNFDDKEFQFGEEGSVVTNYKSKL